MSLICRYKQTMIVAGLIIVGSFIFLTFKDLENAIIFFITYIALVLSLVNSLNNEVRRAKRKKVVIVKGESEMLLYINLSKKLKEMKN